MSGADPRHVWVDGELLPADGPHLSAFDRGVPAGRRHLRDAPGARRAPDGAGGARGAAPAIGRRAWGSSCPTTSRACSRAGSRDLLAAEGLDGADGDASVRVTVSRGAWLSRGLLPPRDERLTATIVIQAWPVAPPPPGAPLARPVARGVERSSRPAEPDRDALKTTSRADYVYARLEARRAGADDALFLTISGHLSEATTANVFLVRGAAGRRRRARDPVARLRDPRPARRARGCCAGQSARAFARSRTWLTPERARGRRRGVRLLVGGGRAPGHPVRRPPDRRRRSPARGPSAPAPTASGSSSRADLRASPSGWAVPVSRRQALAGRHALHELGEAALTGLGALRAHHPVRGRGVGSPSGCASQNAQPAASRRIAASAASSNAQVRLERVDRRPVLAPAAERRLARGPHPPGRAQRLDAAHVPGAPDAAGRAGA